MQRIYCEKGNRKLSTVRVRTPADIAQKELHPRNIHFSEPQLLWVVPLVILE